MMDTPAALGPVSAHVRERLLDLLRERRVVVWYDPRRAFTGLPEALDLPGTIIVSAAGSALQARRDAETAYRRLNEGNGGDAANASLLIYVPTAFETAPEARQQDPFAAFACCGATFGAHEGEGLQALAIAALPAQEAEITRLFREAQPTLALLDRLQTGTQYPLVRQALGSESAVEALSTALSEAAAGEQLQAVPGALAELARLATMRVGLPERQDEDWPALRSRLALHLLISELSFDLPGGLPAALSAVPRAEEEQRAAVLAICERLRTTDAGRDAYVPLAHAAERDLRLSSALAHEMDDPSGFSRRDPAMTFQGQAARPQLQADYGRTDHPQVDLGFQGQAARPQLQADYGRADHPQVDLGFQGQAARPRSQAPSLGTRDTFAIQERLRLRTVVAAAMAGDLAGAQAALAGAVQSVWRRQPERAVLWRAAERCLEFLNYAADLETCSLPRTVHALIDLYSRADGLWHVDHAQRLYEYADAQCEQDDEIEELVALCRARYRSVAERAQSVFQDLVRTGGWPPDGLRRQTQIFDSYVAPELAERRRTAYFLVDSLRYEMGRDLLEKLRDLGEVRLEAATTILPTKTPCGMAALLPGADGAYSFMEIKGDAVPAIAGTPLSGIEERKALLEARYRDRVADITLEELRATTQKRLAKRIGVADLLIVRTQDIDELGEGTSIYRARKFMTEVLGELRTAATRLADLGFQTLVFAADHGHMLLPEVAAGDALPTPPGAWLLKTRRSLLGRAHAGAAGVLRLTARDVGIVGPIDDYVSAAGFKTFKDGEGYFHEGLSLQECVIPVVVARLQQSPVAGGGEQVEVTYRSDRFTSAVVGLKVLLKNASLLSSSLAVRVEAFDGPGPKAKVVGQAADCDARNPTTGEVLLQAGLETPVPLVIDSEFTGPRIEVRATDPRTGATLAHLTLKNDRLV